MSLSSIKLEVREKFTDPDYKAAFLEARLVDEVAHNLRLLREQRNIRQSELAERSGTKQAAISRIERSEQANWNIKTLFRLALALDFRVKIIFQPMEEALREFSLSSETTKAMQPRSKGKKLQATEWSGPASVQDVIASGGRSNRTAVVNAEFVNRHQNKTSSSILETLIQQCN
jgi:transcriptional regulator with XRE-family HTH domain